MTKKSFAIVAAVSAVLLLGGALFYFKDDIDQNISENNLDTFQPKAISQGMLDEITHDLIAESTFTT
ncbi:MAG: hypothetical protein IJA12_00550, partial [Oscillospiraceae bacterium]|nr:hypothetical protein [Oscillospiraceae bacterium]